MTCLEASMASGAPAMIISAILRTRAFSSAARHHVVDQAHGFGFGGADAPAGQDQVHGVLQGHGAGESLQPATAQRGEADARFGQRELGVVGGNRHVAGGDDLRASTERESVHRGDDGLHQVEAVR